MSKRIVIAGASGLIGSSLLALALEHEAVSQVIILVREDLPIKHPKLKQIRVRYEHLEDIAAEILGDAIFCCLGTTRKKTPNPEDYRKVDFDYPLALARIALMNNIPEFHLVSALGADKTSKIFYSRLKGEVEEAISTLSFTSIHFYRPSLLSGNRKEHRTGEELSNKIMKIVNPILIGPLKKYRSIEAAAVARAMLNQSLKTLKGTFIYTSDKIQELA